MGMFSRLARLLKSNINSLISDAEDPEKMLNQLIVDMTEQLGEAKRQVAGSIADEKRLARQLETEAEKAQAWEKKAMLAVKAGNDVLAKEALARKKEHDGHTASYREQWQKQKTGVDQLKLALRALNNKIEEAKRKKGVLIARKKRAEAQKQIHETMSGLRTTSAFEAFDEMAGRIEQAEAEAEASAQMSEEYSGDILADKFAQLEVTHGADDELLELKRKMGLAPAEVAAEPETAGGQQVRVEEEFDSLSADEQAELAKALAELDAEDTADLQAKR